MIKIDKSITLDMHSIIEKCSINNIDANTRIQKLGITFVNARQMVVQLDVYLAFSLTLHHSFRTFQFINIFLLKNVLWC